MIEYVMECDEEYMEERAIPPHGKWVSVCLDIHVASLFKTNRLGLSNS